MSIADFSGRSRLDACPGALQVHPAADGGLARVRIPGGRLTPYQLRELADAATAYGNGVIELTSRANVQVRGLGPENPESGPENGFAARMARAGLLPSATHERIRNILASPLTGVDGPAEPNEPGRPAGSAEPNKFGRPNRPTGPPEPSGINEPSRPSGPNGGDAPNGTKTNGRGIADITPLIGELDRRLCARPALAALPGRFMFALDDGRGDVAGLGADATILPTAPDAAALLLAGTDTGLRVPLDEAVTVLLATAEAFLDELATRDVTAWRIAELPDGPSRIATRMRTALGLPDTPPFEPVRPHVVTSGPVGVFESTDRRGNRTGVTGETGPGNSPRHGVEDGDPDDPRSEGSRVTLGVAIPLGRLTSAQALLLADAASGGEIRLTPWRGVVLPGLDRAEVTGTAARLEAAGLVVDPASPWIGVTACTGRPGCAKSLADVQADAATAIGMAPPSTMGPGTDTLPVHWAGCARRCGRPRGRVADVIATGDGYRLELDGTALTCSGIEETAAAVAAARGEM
ncbi:precorrin-3B synthase [Streptosporangium sp. NPDC000095]|uniref:precorrin-3B synthase n=1 Tax=Streptosporangium sp. NPDC000095 TaxID=3366184 RepID=UPI0036D1CA2B